MEVLQHPNWIVLAAVIHSIRSLLAAESRDLRLFCRRPRSPVAHTIFYFGFPRTYACSALAVLLGRVDLLDRSCDSSPPIRWAVTFPYRRRSPSCSLLGREALTRKVLQPQSGHLQADALSIVKRPY